MVSQRLKGMSAQLQLLKPKKREITKQIHFEPKMFSIDSNKLLYFSKEYFSTSVPIGY
jgi:uncharacterized protein YdhG (YjbR/CyaY superfamily)